MSTTGQGEFPDSMKVCMSRHYVQFDQTFWKELMSKKWTAMGAPLERLHFAVFSLGDSSYRSFNFAGKKLYRRLLHLHAQELIRRGEGDDQAKFGYEEELIPWLQDLWQKILTFHPLPSGVDLVPSNVLYPFHLIYSI